MKGKSKSLIAIICMSLMLFSGVKFAAGAEEMTKDMMTKEGKMMTRDGRLMTKEGELRIKEGELQMREGQLLTEKGKALKEGRKPDKTIQMEEGDLLRKREGF